MAGERCLLDSNILIRWVQPAATEYTDVHTSIEMLARRDISLCYTSQNLGEFWNACTRPVSRNGFGMTPANVDLRARYIETRLRLLPDSEAIHEEWRKLLITHRVSGAQVHDTRIAAAMYVHGARQILTYNTRDFRRFAEIEAMDPANIVRSA